MLGAHSPIQKHNTIGSLLEISNVVTFVCNDNNTDSSIYVAFSVTCSSIRGIGALYSSSHKMYIAGQQLSRKKNRLGGIFKKRNNIDDISTKKDGLDYLIVSGNSPVNFGPLIRMH